MDELALQQAMYAGAVFDGILNSILNNFKPDLRKINHELMKTGVGNVFDSLKPAIPGPVDDMIYDAAKAAMCNIIDGWKNTAPLIVGAAPATDAEYYEHAFGSNAKRLRNRKEVEDMIIAEGGDPKRFAPWLLLALQFLPTAIDIIRKLLGK